MRNDNPNIYFIIFSSLMLVMLAASQAHAASKGPKGTPERESYCKSKLDKCIAEANADCEVDYINGTTESSLCKASEVKTCKNAYGGTSDCMTRDRVSRDSVIMKATGDQKVLVAPESSTGSTSNTNTNMENPEEEEMEALVGQGAFTAEFVARPTDDCDANNTRLCVSNRATCDVLHGANGSTKDVCRWTSANSASACKNTVGIWTTSDSRYARNNPDAVNPGSAGACLTEVNNIRK